MKILSYALLFIAFTIAIYAGLIIVGQRGQVDAHKTAWGQPYWGEWGECKTDSETTCGATLQGYKYRTLYQKCESSEHDDDKCKPGDVREVIYHGKPVTDKEKCEVKLPACPVDVCPNLDGIQETLPGGMMFSGASCVPFVQDHSGPVAAPQGPSCEAPKWAPTLTFDGKEFHWTTVKDGLHTYWMDYGPTKDKLPYSVVVNGESFRPKVEWKGQTWARVAGDDQGCVGPFSLVVDP